MNGFRLTGRKKAKLQAIVGQVIREKAKKGINVVPYFKVLKVKIENKQIVSHNTKQLSGLISELKQIS